MYTTRVNFEHVELLLSEIKYDRGGNILIAFLFEDHLNVRFRIIRPFNFVKKSADFPGRKDKIHKICSLDFRYCVNCNR